MIHARGTSVSFPPIGIAWDSIRRAERRSFGTTRLGRRRGTETGRIACPPPARRENRSSSRLVDCCASCTDSVEEMKRDPEGRPVPMQSCVACLFSFRMAGIKTAVSNSRRPVREGRAVRPSNETDSERGVQCGAREYTARHDPDEVTDAINRAVDELDYHVDEFLAVASHRVLENTEW